MENFKTNGDIFIFIRNNHLDRSDCNVVTDSITATLNIEISTSASKALQNKISTFLTHLKSRWIASRCDYTKFCKSNEKWLNSSFLFPTEVTNLIPYSSNSHIPPKRSKSFENLSERYKRKKTQEIRNNPDMLDFIMKKKLKSDEAHFIYDFIQKYPEHVEKVKKFCENILDGTQVIDKESCVECLRFSESNTKSI